jgi:hypothetical protein
MEQSISCVFTAVWDNCAQPRTGQLLCTHHNLASCRVHINDALPTILQLPLAQWATAHYDLRPRTAPVGGAVLHLALHSTGLSLHTQETHLDRLSALRHGVGLFMRC